MSWDEILKARKPIEPTLRNSAHMMQCIRGVKANHPTADIIQRGPESWQLMEGPIALSNEHNSHYACWNEARKIIESLS